MSILLWIILGGLAGWIASMITETNAQMGVLANVAVGIVGALIGGFVASLLGADGVTGFNLYSFMIALIGAVVVLGLLNVLSRNRGNRVER